jgi:hypothetical protein
MGRYVTPALMSAILSAGYNVDFIDAKAINKVGLGDHQILLLPYRAHPGGDAEEDRRLRKAGGGKAIAFGRCPRSLPKAKPLGDAGGDTSEIALVTDEASLTKALQQRRQA